MCVCVCVLRAIRTEMVLSLKSLWADVYVFGQSERSERTVSYRASAASVFELALSGLISEAIHTHCYYLGPVEETLSTYEHVSSALWRAHSCSSS